MITIKCMWQYGLWSGGVKVRSRWAFNMQNYNKIKQDMMSCSGAVHPDSGTYSTTHVASLTSKNNTFEIYKVDQLLHFYTNLQDMQALNFIFFKTKGLVLKSVMSKASVHHSQSRGFRMYMQDDFSLHKLSLPFAFAIQILRHSFRQLCSLSFSLSLLILSLIRRMERILNCCVRIFQNQALLVLVLSINIKGIVYSEI